VKLNARPQGLSTLNDQERLYDSIIFNNPLAPAGPVFIPDRRMIAKVIVNEGITRTMVLRFEGRQKARKNLDLRG
jgi:hypothetical protein